MNDAARLSIIAAWHENVTADDLAARFRVTSRTVRRVWDAATGAGDLPLTPRPFFVDRTRKPERAPEAEADHDEPDTMAAAPAQSARLLAALKRNHPDLDHRDAHIASELLAAERARAAKEAAEQEKEQA